MSLAFPLPFSELPKLPIFFKQIAGKSEFRKVNPFADLPAIWKFLKKIQEAPSVTVPGYGLHMELQAVPGFRFRAVPLQKGFFFRFFSVQV